MKVNLNRVGAGVAALLLSAGFLISGGCSSSKVLEQRPYIPAPSGDDDVTAVEQSAAPVAPVAEAAKPAPLDTPPPFQPVAPAPFKSELPPIRHSSHKSAAVASRGEAQTYTIQKGDSLWKIGHKFGVSTHELAAFNNIPENKVLIVGKTLRIPATGYKAPKSAARKKTAPALASSGKSAARTAKSTGAAPAKAASVGAGGIYVVQKGDSFWKIARKLKVSSAALAAANNKKPTDMLHVGQKLVVPGKDAVAKTAKAGKTAAAKAATSETDEMLKDLDVTTDVAKPAKTEAPTAEAAEKAETAAPTTEAAPQTQAQNNAAADKALVDIDTGLQAIKTRTVEVPEDTTVEQFAAARGVKVEEVRKLNTEIGPDGRLKKGSIITIPE